MPRGKPKDYDWSKTRVWWSARHKWSGMVHLAASIGGGRVTRCGIRIYAGGKQYKLYDWVKHGNSPIPPSCGQCLRLHRHDLGIDPIPSPAKFSGKNGKEGDDV